MEQPVNLCPFCFEPIFSNGPCPHCGHWIGEPIQGLQQLPVGWILDGKYRIGMTLGQGGFGITYLAYDMNLQQKVAIKEYFPGGLVTRSAQTVMPFTQSGQTLYQKGVDAFYREAQLLARFQNHPNIVHIHNFFRENNTAYFVMEYVEGKSLAAYLDEKGGRLSQEETISLLSPIMDALDVLHQAGILHRDIAPDNIYLTKSGQVKLLDFGAAKNELRQHTHSSAAILKPGYAPLEQYSATGNQGPWTDVYAMGAVIYRCLTGTMPPDSPDRITGRAIIPINASGAKLSKKVETAVMKALSLNIPDRWQRMSDFKKALLDTDVRVSASKQDTKHGSNSRSQQWDVTPAYTVQKSNTGKKGGISRGFIMIILFLIILGLFGMFLLNRCGSDGGDNNSFTGNRAEDHPANIPDSKNVLNAVVSSQTWQTSVEIIELEEQHGSGWRDSIPPDARDLRCQDRLLHTYDDEVANSVEVCGTPYAIDIGNGSEQFVQDCVYNVYESYCEYTVSNTKVVDTVSASGSGPNPEVPYVDTKYSTGNQSVSYTVQFRDENGNIYTLNPANLSEYRTYTVGTEFEIEVNNRGLIVSVEKK